MNVLNHALYLPKEEEIKLITLPPSLKRRAPRIWKIAYAAAENVIRSSPVRPDAIVCGTALGALHETTSFLDKVYDEGMGSPRQFIASVHNSMAGMLAKEFQVTGSNMTVCESHNSLASAISVANYLPEKNILIISVDEKLPLLDEIYKECPHSEAFNSAPQDGAFAMMISKEVESKSHIYCSSPKPVEHTEQFSGSFLSLSIDLSNLLDMRMNGIVHSFAPTTGCAASIEVVHD